jgi:hypothetical protein
MVRDDGYLKMPSSVSHDWFETRRKPPGLAQSTAPGAVMGTIAPCPRAGGEPTGTPADIFALGIVFYELVTAITHSKPSPQLCCIIFTDADSAFCVDWEPQPRCWMT